MKKVIKAGGLTSGHAKSGSVVHLTESDRPYAEKALCGAKPRIQWSEVPDMEPVTCRYCLKKVGGK